MLDESVKNLLHDFHGVSEQWESAFEDQATMGQGSYHRMTIEARELVSRCILSGNQVSVTFLIEQLSLLLRLIGRPDDASLMTTIVQHMVKDFKDRGGIIFP